MLLEEGIVAYDDAGRLLQVLRYETTQYVVLFTGAGDRRVDRTGVPGTPYCCKVWEKGPPPEAWQRIGGAHKRKPPRREHAPMIYTSSPRGATPSTQPRYGAPPVPHERGGAQTPQSRLALALLDG